MQVIVVSGLPCSGKTKCADALGAELHWPLLCKDTYKELLFDTLGHSDRAWSKRMSAAAYALQFAYSAQLRACRVDHLLEGNFRWDEHSERFAALCEQPVTLLQVHCRADAAVLVARFRQRAQSASRHPGHVDAESLPELESELSRTPQIPLPLPGMTIECDTTVDWRTAIAAAVKTVKSRLSFLSFG